MSIDSGFVCRSAPALTLSALGLMACAVQRPPSPSGTASSGTASSGTASSGTASSGTASSGTASAGASDVLPPSRPAASQQAPLRGVVYAEVEGQSLRLDLHRPQTRPAVGVIVWVHGGAWRAGSRDSADLAPMTSRGWAVASVDYRLSTAARFPAQVHDIKAAARFLRAEAERLELPAGPFVIAGASAGGHLAALVGVSGSHPGLEGRVGPAGGSPSNLEQSSSFQAIVDFYGASNLQTILGQSSQHGLNVRVPALALLLGGQPSQLPELARLASPVAHVGPGDPPLFLVHGDADPQMPIEQAYELREAYDKQGLRVLFKVLRGEGHGGPAFVSAPMLDAVDAFLRQELSLRR